MNLSFKDLEILSSVLAAESMACKKARMYSKTLTEQSLAECMESIAMRHAERFNAVLQIILK